MAQLKDLIVSGATRILGKTYSPEFVGKLTGNADTATRATGDSNGQNIVSTYIKNLSIDGKTLNIYKGNGSNSSLIIKDKIYAGNRITTIDDLNKFIEQGTFKYGIINPLEGLNGLEKNDGIVLSFSWDNSTAWGHQIFLDDSSYNMAHRHLNNGTWQAWVKMIDANNYTNYTVTKTGSGASGTWGISITGNSGTATKLQTARTISLIGSVTGSGSFDGSGNLTISTTTNHTHNQYYDSGISRAANTVLAAPNGSAGSATFRKLVAADLPDSYLPLSGGTMSGTINFTVNKLAMNFRNDTASYYTGIMYQTTGNEALVFAAKNAVTSFMFKCGLDPTTMTSSTWTTTIPSVQIKGQSLYVNSLIANGSAPSYNFYVNGTSYLTGRLITTANIYTNRGRTSASSFQWNKSGTYFGGIGYHGTSNENYLGPTNEDGSWADTDSDTWYIRGKLKTGAIGSSKNTYIAFPLDGGYRNTESKLTGYLKITLPQSWTSTMLSFKVKIYNYVEEESCEYVVGGYNYAVDKKWYHCTAYSIGNNNDLSKSNLPVQIGHDGSKCAIYIGKADTIWTYPQVQICDILVGFQNYEYEKWVSGWSISFTTTLGTISDTFNNPSINISNKLLNSRNLWGQPFNGTANVSGQISDCTRICNKNNNAIYLGNADNSSWVYTQDIGSQSGTNYWAINVAGKTWFQRVNVGYNYGSQEDSYIFRVNGSSHLEGKVLIKGDAASKPLQVRGIVGNDSATTVGDLYLQYQANSMIYLGNTAGYTISADGSKYSGTSSYATTVVDYGDSSKNIKIGFSGSGISGDNIKYIAGYTNGDGGNNIGKIKDISKSALQSWLGLGSLAYSNATIPTSLKCPYSLSIQLNSGTATVYDGSAAKSINITPSAIGASASGHTHNYAGSSSPGGAANSANKLNKIEHLDTVDKLNAFIEGGVFKYATVAALDGLDGLSKNDGIILCAPWASNTYGHQIYLDDNGYTLAHRYKSTNWAAWKLILDSNNYTSYTVTKTGSGASGTWGINITGNAATATALTSSAGSSTQPIYFFNGKPLACNSTLSVSITGNAATSTTTFAITTVANNEIRFTKPSTALAGNALYIGYAWADGTKSKMINEYRFCGGDGNLTQVTATTFNGNLSGNASSASNADTVDGYHASSLWRADGAVWNPGANVKLNASDNSQEWSFDISRNGKTGCYWHVWDSSYGSLLKVTADDGKVSAPYNFVGKLEGTAKTLAAGGNLDFPMTFNWSGQGGQPTWLWGGNDYSNIYVYNPSNFNVNHATSSNKLNMQYNVVTSTANDTTSNWANMGCICNFNTLQNQLNGQPSQYGLIFSMGTPIDVHQIWMTQASGSVYHRGGNSAGWNGSWSRFLTVTEDFYRPGSSFTVHLTCGGFCTEYAKNVYFTIPLDMPTSGVSGVSIRSSQGLIIRQNNSYLYGSGVSKYIQPSSYSARLSHGTVWVYATFGNTTNATNNSACGCTVDVVVTFS